MKNELIAYNDPKSSVAEAVKIIRTNLDFLKIDKPIKSIMITSSVPGEGKSFIASNLAVAFAQAGKKTLLIDADLRRGRLHHVFNEENNGGYPALLMADVVKDVAKKTIIETEIPDLFLLTRGKFSANPSEMLSSEKNREVYNYLVKRDDILIFDAPPVIGLSDSLAIANLVDKIIIVSAYKQTKIDELGKAKKALAPFSEKIAGVVLNKMPESSNKYYYYG